MPTSADQIKDLKAMIALAKRKPVNIGICLGLSPEQTVVKLHRSRPPPSLERDAKSEGATPKAACGAIEISGKDVKFTCEGLPPPGIARQLKMYFKTIGILLNFDVTTAAKT